MAGYPLLTAERRDGLCVVRVTGDLDTTMADTFADHADEAVRALPGPVRVDLWGVTFIDAHGARALAAVLQAWAADRQVAIRSCPPHVSRVMELLGLPADYLPDRDSASPGSETFQRVDRIRRARLQGVEVKLGARQVLTRLGSTRIRLSSTQERNGLVEQGRRTVASSRAAREHLRRSRQQAAT
jgi:anti-anti-sigma factor